MRILHIISSGGMYGAEAVILNLSRTLNEHGHTSLLGIFSNSSNPNLQLHERALAEGIESHLIPCNGQIDRTVPASIRALAATTNADLIHAHGYKADVYAYLALRKTSDTARLHLPHLVRRQPPRLALRRHRPPRPSPLQRRHRRIRRRPPAPPRLRSSGQPHPLHPQRHRPPPLHQRHSLPSPPRRTPEGLLIGWVGRLTHDKGPDLFLRAIAQLRPDFPTARYLMVGEGPFRPEVERLITDLALGDIVHLLGQRSDMPAVYASCDLMVSSSRLEGLPMAILEGMAASLPWVAPSVGAIPLAIRNDQNGILIPPENVEILATSMARMMRTPEERARMGTAGRQPRPSRSSPPSGCPKTTCPST